MAQKSFAVPMGQVRMQLIQTVAPATELSYANQLLYIHDFSQEMKV